MRSLHALVHFLSPCGSVESWFWFDSVGVCFRYCEFRPGSSFEAFVFVSLVFLFNRNGNTFRRLSEWYRSYILGGTGLSKALGS